VVFQLSGPAQAEPSKPLVKVPHAQILALYEACANLLAFRVASSVSVRNRSYFGRRVLPKNATHKIHSNGQYAKSRLNGFE